MKEDLDRLIDEMLEKGLHYDEARREIERRFISRALVQSQGNLGRAADILGIHRNTLTRKVTTYRLKRLTRNG